MKAGAPTAIGRESPHTPYVLMCT